MLERHSPDFALSLEQGKGRQGVLHHLLQGVAELDIMYLGENNSCVRFIFFRSNRWSVIENFKSHALEEEITCSVQDLLHDVTLTCITSI